MATYNPLTSVVLTANTTTVTISNIPQDYTDLRVVMTPASGSGTNGIRMRINGDSGSNYSITYMSGNGSLSRTARENDAVNMSLNGYFGINTSTSFTQLYQIDLLSYTNTVAFKSALVRIGGGNDATEYNQGTWRSTAAISSLSFNINTFGSSTGDFIAGSRFDVYGIKAGTPKATGGDVITTDGTYWYHAFKNSGTFTVQQDSALAVDYLVVAGGGAGGYDCGGGGGAGGYRTASNFSCAGGSSSVVLVGAGGANTMNRGLSGSNSVFASITSTGGGGGGSRVSTYGAGADGGSGGGGGGDNLGAGGAASPAGQGNAGGRGSAGATPGGGGGGAGAAGTNTTNEQTPGNGGAGLNTLSSWATATGTGASGYYAGGGGGGYNAQSNGGAGGGGYGGGGPNYNSYRAPASGTANTGGGGGGGTNSVTPASVYAGAGGSGIVIVRYAV